jgi:hypothetical protein
MLGGIAVALGKKATLFVTGASLTRLHPPVKSSNTNPKANSANDQRDILCLLINSSI